MQRLRQRLGRWSLWSWGLMLVLGLAACGEGGTTAPTANTAPAGAPTAAATSGGTAATMAPAAAPAKKGGTVRVELDSDIANLDPMQSSLLVDREVLYSIYDSLVAIDTNLKIVQSPGGVVGDAGPKDLYLPSARGREVSGRHGHQRGRREIQYRP